MQAIQKIFNAKLYPYRVYTSRKQGKLFWTAVMSDIFSRNILLWGEKVQKKLFQSSVLIAGVGGLGCVVAEILVRSGIGKLILLDNKTIDEPDLNRQLLYSVNDLGKEKVIVAAKKLRAMTGKTKIEPIKTSIADTKKFQKIMRSLMLDGAADCLDNFKSRFVLEKLLPPKSFMVHGGAQRDFGQITSIVKGETAPLQHFFCEHASVENPIPICPSAVCVIASIMAHEIINNLIGAPQLKNEMLIIELSDFSMFRQKISTPEKYRRHSNAAKLSSIKR